MTSSGMVGIGLRALRQAEERDDDRPQGGADDAADEVLEAGELGAGERPYRDYDDVVNEEESENVQHLRGDGEHAHAPVQHDPGVGEYGVGERMLAEERAVGDVHGEPEEPGRHETDAARRLYAPVEHHERDEVRLDPEPVARPRQQVEKQRHDERRGDEAGLDRQQDLVRRDAVLGHQPFLDRFGRGDFCSSTGRGGTSGRPMTIRNWVRLATPASGLQVIRAKSWAALRSTLDTSATGNPGG